MELTSASSSKWQERKSQHFILLFKILFYSLSLLPKWLKKILMGIFTKAQFIYFGAGCQENCRRRQVAVKLPERSGRWSSSWKWIPRELSSSELQPKVKLVTWLMKLKLETGLCVAHRAYLFSRDIAATMIFFEEHGSSSTKHVPRDNSQSWHRFSYKTLLSWQSWKSRQRKVKTWVGIFTRSEGLKK